MASATRHSPPKQRRGSLPASPALNAAMSSWAFRDEMGLPAMSGVDKLDFLPERAQSTSGIPLAPVYSDSSTKRMRKKWSPEETQMLVDGCNVHGVGNWKAILNDSKLIFEPGRTAVDLKDRFRTHFPDAYRQHYPNAKTHLSDKRRSTLADGSSIFEKNRTKRRRPFSPEEDEALRRGYEIHGTLWATIVQDPVFQAQQRRSTDLRDRFRNAFPDLYEAAGYKGRTAIKKGALPGQSPRPIEDTRPSRAVRRRLTYPGLIRPQTNMDDAADSSGDEEELPGCSRLPPSTSHSQADEAAAPMQLDPSPSRPSLSRRSTSPNPDHDSRSISSHSHVLSGPGSPVSPKLGLASPDVGDIDEIGHHIDWNALNWMGLTAPPRFDHGQSTSSSIFSGNFFGSHHSAPRHDVLDRYDLYSSPLVSSMNAFGDYASEMGIGGSFSEADMDFNAFGGPATSMGFTHHSQVAGDLIFASHHGGHLQHGHGFGLQSSAQTGVSTASAGPIGLGLTDIGFAADPTSQHEPAYTLEPIIDEATLALINPSHSAPSISPVPFDLRTSTNFGIAPADLHKHPIPSLTPTDSIPSLQHHMNHLQYESLPIRPASSLPALPSMPGPSASRRVAATAHLRSASQPPTNLHAFAAQQRDHLGTPRTQLRDRTITMDDNMQHYPHRTPDPFSLPFLDLHYYVTGETAPAAAAAAGRPPDRPNQFTAHRSSS